MDVFVQSLTAWDRRVFAEVNHGLKNPVLDAVMPRISDLGLGHVQVLFVLMCAIAAAWRRGEIGWRRLLSDSWTAIIHRSTWVSPILIAFALSGIGATLFKHSIDRDRPWWFYYHEHHAGRSLDINVETVIGRRPVRVRGFLSGHTATSVALATAGTMLFWRRRRLRPLVIGSWALACLISLSRIYIADHWPLDVVCGAALGIGCGLIAVSGYRHWIASVCHKPETEESNPFTDNTVSTGPKAT